jgi:enoyl-[acyl-carrier protein] reductase II
MAKKGMFEGDLVNGELEIGQVSAIINEITTAESVVKELMDDCKKILIQTAAGFNFG